MLVIVVETQSIEKFAFDFVNDDFTIDEYAIAIEYQCRIIRISHNPCVRPRP